MEKIINISIIICSYNSVFRIESTLDHISKQELDGLNCEIILVDNNCSDSTVSISKEKWAELGSPFPLIIIKEKESGLSYARKSGVMAAKGEIIVFCDDDNWLEEHYCKVAYDILKSDQNIGVLGGRGIPASDVDFPFWFTTCQGGYAVGVQNINTGYVDNRGYLWGAGMSLRTREIKNLYVSGFNSILTGRSQKNLSSGEDSEICKWFLLVGKRLYYSEDLIYHHFIEKSRLSKQYLEKLNFGFREAYEILNLYNRFYALLYGKVSINFILLCLRSALNIFRRIPQNYSVEWEYYNSTKFTFNKNIKNLKSYIKNYQAHND